MENIVILVLIGKANMDPACPLFLGKLFKLFLEKQIPIFYCLEWAENHTLEDIKSYFEGQLARADFYIQDEKIKALLKEDLAYKYFSFLDRKRLESIIKEDFPNIEKKEISGIVDFGLMRYPALQPTLKLISEVEEYKIPYLFIDKFNEVSPVSDEAFLAQENDRIATMIGNIFKGIVSFKKSGIFIVDTGIYHGPNLYYALKDSYRHNPEYHQQFDLEILNYNIYSPYSKIIKESVKENLKLTDPKYLNEKLPDIEDLYCEEKNKKLEFPFLNNLLTRILNNFSAHIENYLMVDFYIPNFDKAKRDLVEKLGGVCRREVGKGAIIAITPSSLDKESRKTLGIHRCLVTLGAPEEMLKQLSELEIEEQSGKFIKSVTIENDPKEKVKYKKIITFPNCLFSKVEKILKLDQQSKNNQPESFENKAEKSSGEEKSEQPIINRPGPG